MPLAAPVTNAALFVGMLLLESEDALGVAVKDLSITDSE